MSKPATANPADAPIVVLHGPERFLMVDFTERVRGHLIKKHGDVQTTNFDGLSTKAGDVLDELRSMSLMMTHKLVIVENADSMLKETEDEDAPPPPPTPAKRGTAARTAREMMESYAASPEPSATLVLRASKWTGGNLEKAIEKSGGVVVKCEAPRVADAAAWCVQRAGQHKARIDANTAKLLVDNIGPDLGRLDMELAKLAVAAAASGVGTGVPAITPELIATFVGFSREEDLWSMQRHLLSGDAGNALREVRHRLEVSRENPIAMLVCYIDLARKLDGAARGIAAKENPKALSGRLKLWGSSESTIMDMARRLRPSQTAELLGAAIDADHRCKTGRGEPERLLEVLTLKFVNLR